MRAQLDDALKAESAMRLLALEAESRGVACMASLEGANARVTAVAAEHDAECSRLRARLAEVEAALRDACHLLPDDIQGGVWLEIDYNHHTKTCAAPRLAGCTLFHSIPSDKSYSENNIMALYHLHWDYEDAGWSCVLPATIHSECFKTMKIHRVCITVSRECRNKAYFSPPILVDTLGGSSVHFGNAITAGDNVQLEFYSETSDCQPYDGGYGKGVTWVHVDDYATLPAFYVKGFVDEDYMSDTQKRLSVVDQVSCGKLCALAEKLGSNAAKCIQRAWRRCVSDPSYYVCRRRLLREYETIC
jgi:hypothetical protein